jgi:multiple sugar transport system permease protein
MTTYTGTAQRRSAKRMTGKGLMFALLGVFVVFFLLPILWMLLATTKNAGSLISGHSLSFGSFGQLRRNWDHLMAFQDGAVKTWMKNSVLYSGLALVITLAVSIPAGYAMAKMHFRGRRLLLITTLVVMLMPASSLVLPTFLEMNYAHLVNTPLSVVLPYSFFPFGVYLTYIYFSTTVPADLLAAARIDGAGEFRAFFYIALPLAAPVVALVGFFSFVGNWNNFFLPYLVLPNSDEFPLQVGLNQLLTSTPSFNPVAGAGLDITIPELALAIVVAILPVLVLFLFSQRTLVSGMLAGATKE